MSYERYSQKRQSDWESQNHLDLGGDRESNYTFYISGGTDVAAAAPPPNPDDVSDMSSSAPAGETYHDAMASGAANGDASTAENGAAKEAKGAGMMEDGDSAEGSAGAGAKGMGFTHEEDAAAGAAVVSKREKAKRHCARFWPWYCLANVVFLAIFLPCLFLLIIPAIAQDVVNAVNLPIYNAEMHAVNESSVLLGMNTSISLPAKLHPALDPVELWLYNKDTEGFKPFTMIKLDRQQLGGTTPIVIMDQSVQIYDYDELNIWLQRTFYQNTTAINIKGNTTAHLGKLKSHIQLTKSVDVAGLRQLEGIELTDATIMLPAQDDGSNIKGELNLPNWSIINLGLKNVKINLMAGTTAVGAAQLTDVFLAPGNNSVPFAGEIFITQLVANFMTIMQSQMEPLSRGVLRLGLTGNETTDDNGGHIDYLEKVLNNANLETEVPLAQLGSDLVNSVTSGNLQLSAIITLLQDGVAGSELLQQLLKEFLTNLGNAENEFGNNATTKRTTIGDENSNSNSERSDELELATPKTRRGVDVKRLLEISNRTPIKRDTSNLKKVQMRAAARAAARMVARKPDRVKELVTKKMKKIRAATAGTTRVIKKKSPV